jgi:hypothetical protein
MGLMGIAVLVFAGAGLAACAMPAGSAGTSQTAAAKHGYQDPTTGSVFDGPSSEGLSSGVNDPGSGQQTNGRGGS